MKNDIDWGTTSLRELRRLARPHTDMTSAVEWLKVIGLMPKDVERLNKQKALLEMDPESIGVHYLSSVAFEWDAEGPSSPDDFIRALSAECRGAKRDLIVETLVLLGREQTEQAAA